MEQASETKYAAVSTEACDYLQERRSRIVLEQEREVTCKHTVPLRVTFRRSDEEERLVSLLSSRTE